MNTLDYYYMFEHRRLRQTYRWKTIQRHEKQIMAALEKRHAIFKQKEKK